MSLFFIFCSPLLLFLMLAGRNPDASTRYSRKCGVYFTPRTAHESLIIFRENLVLFHRKSTPWLFFSKVVCLVSKRCCLHFFHQHRVSFALRTLLFRFYPRKYLLVTFKDMLLPFCSPNACFSVDNTEYLVSQTLGTPRSEVGVMQSSLVLLLRGGLGCVEAVGLATGTVLHFLLPTTHRALESCAT